MNFKTIKAGIAALALLLPGCSKKESAQPAGTTIATQSPAFRKDGGDDDDGLVIMHISQTADAVPVSNVVVTLVNQADTVRGYSNQAGECLLRLSRTGIWMLHVHHPYFRDVYAQINITDSFTTRTDTLTQQ